MINIAGNGQELSVSGKQFKEEKDMAKEHIPAGSEVRPGTYQCNACANEFVCTEDGEKLPMCCVCDSMSWRSRQRSTPCRGPASEKKS